MPPPSMLPGMSWPRWCGPVLAAWIATAPLAAQELPLRDDSGGAACPTEPVQTIAPAEEARETAKRLGSEADEALQVGRRGDARALLNQALAFHPSSADLRYRRALLLQDLGETSNAIPDLCHVAATAPKDEIGEDARRRLEQMGDRGREANVPDSARAAASLGVREAQSRNFDAALAAFDEAIRQAPQWADASYNRGVTLARMGRDPEAARELRRYLSLAPRAPDMAAVTQRVQELERLLMALRGAPSPGTALGLGLLVPGMGQFYAGRTTGGLTVLGLATGAVLTGFLVTEVHIRCLDPVEAGQSCPADQIVSRRQERPHLVPAIGVAATVAVIGAVEALIEARGRNRARAGVFGPTVSQGPRLSGPSLEAQGTRVDLNLLGLRFR